jgi:hypothetical protein
MSYKNLKPILNLLILFLILFSFIGAAAASHAPLEVSDSDSGDLGKMSDSNQGKSVSTPRSSNSEVRDVTLDLESPSTIAFLIIAGLIALIGAYFILSKS